MRCLAEMSHCKTPNCVNKIDMDLKKNIIFILIICNTFLLFSCSGEKDAGGKNTTKAEKLISKKDVSAITKKNHLKCNYDEFDKITWVSTNNIPVVTNRNGSYLYVNSYFGFFDRESVNATKGPLRLRIAYDGRSWLFIRKVTFNIDGENYELFPAKIKREVVSHVDLYETIDLPEENYPSNILTKIQNSKIVRVRLTGDNRTEDFVFNDAIKKQIGNIRKFWSQF